MTTNSIQNFVSRMGIYGLLKPNRYTVQFVPTPLLATPLLGGTNRGSKVGSLIQLLSGQPYEFFSDLCEDVSIPGSSISSSGVKINGPIREFPYERAYTGELILMFRIDENMLLRNYFMRWQNAIIDPISQRVAFYDDYVQDILIKVYSGDLDLDSNERLIYSCTVKEAYPKEIAEIGMGHGLTDTYMRQSVTLAYRKIEEDYTPVISRQPTG